MNPKQTKFNFQFQQTNFGLLKILCNPALMFISGRFPLRGHERRMGPLFALALIVRNPQLRKDGMGGKKKFAKADRASMPKSPRIRFGVISCPHVTGKVYVGFVVSSKFLLDVSSLSFSHFLCFCKNFLDRTF